jgi:hypothetical protein
MKAELVSDGCPLSGSYLVTVVFSHGGRGKGFLLGLFLKGTGSTY